MYKCRHCHYRSNSPKTYSHHYAIHGYINNTSFPCGVPGCTRAFRAYESFTSHLSRDHCNYRVSHSITAKSSDTSTSSECHNVQLGQVDLEDKLVDLTCTLCEMPCDQYSVLLAHLKEHIKNGAAVNCPFKGCTSEYRFISSLTSHLSRIHPTLPCKPLISDSATGSGCPVMSPSVECTANDCNIEGNNLEMQEQVPAVEEDETNSDESLSDDVFLESVALFYLGLESKQHVPQSTLQKIVTGVCNFHISQDQLQLQLKKPLKKRT